MEILKLISRMSPGGALDNRKQQQQKYMTFGGTSGSKYRTLDGQKFEYFDEYTNLWNPVRSANKNISKEFANAWKKQTGGAHDGQYYQLKDVQGQKVRHYNDGTYYNETTGGFGNYTDNNGKYNYTRTGARVNGQNIWDKDLKDASLKFSNNKWILEKNPEDVTRTSDDSKVKPRNTNWWDNSWGSVGDFQTWMKDNGHLSELGTFGVDHKAGRRGSFTNRAFNKYGQQYLESRKAKQQPQQKQSELDIATTDYDNFKKAGYEGFKSQAGNQVFQQTSGQPDARGGYEVYNLKGRDVYNFDGVGENASFRRNLRKQEGGFDYYDKTTGKVMHSGPLSRREFRKLWKQQRDYTGRNNFGGDQRTMNYINSAGGKYNHMTFNDKDDMYMTKNLDENAMRANYDKQLADKKANMEFLQQNETQKPYPSRVSETPKQETGSTWNWETGSIGNQQSQANNSEIDPQEKERLERQKWAESQKNGATTMKNGGEFWRTSFKFRNGGAIPKGQFGWIGRAMRKGGIDAAKASAEASKEGIKTAEDAVKAAQEALAKEMKSKSARQMQFKNSGERLRRDWAEANKPFEDIMAKGDGAEAIKSIQKKIKDLKSKQGSMDAAKYDKKMNKLKQSLKEAKKQSKEYSKAENDLSNQRVLQEQEKLDWVKNYRNKFKTTNGKVKSAEDLVKESQEGVKTATDAHKKALKGIQEAEEKANSAAFKANLAGYGTLAGLAGLYGFFGGDDKEQAQEETIPAPAEQSAEPSQEDLMQMLYDQFQQGQPAETTAPVAPAAPEQPAQPAQPATPAQVTTPIVTGAPNLTTIPDYVTPTQVVVQNTPTVPLKSYSWFYDGTTRGLKNRQAAANSVNPVYFRDPINHDIVKYDPNIHTKDYFKYLTQQMQAGLGYNPGVQAMIQKTINPTVVQAAQQYVNNQLQ